MPQFGHASVWSCLSLSHASVWELGCHASRLREHVKLFCFRTQ